MSRPAIPREVDKKGVNFTSSRVSISRVEIPLTFEQIIW